jgi:hypothetical protein
MTQTEGKEEPQAAPPAEAAAAAPAEAPPVEAKPAEAKPAGRGKSKGKAKEVVRPSTP